MITPNVVVFGGGDINAARRLRRVRYNPFCGAGGLVARALDPLPTPAVPAGPMPADGATGVPAGWATGSVSWAASLHADRYDVFFGTAATPVTAVAIDQAGTSWHPPADLAYSTTYYWQVIAQNGPSIIAAGPIWSFTTGAPTAPAVPSGPSPFAGQPYVLPGAQLSWTATPGATSYDVLFGTAPIPVTTIGSSQVATTADPGTLTYGVTYAWQVIAHNAIGDTAGPIWSFVMAPPPPPLLAPPAVIQIGGVPVPRVRIKGLTIQDVLNAAPNTCTILIEGTAPQVGQAVSVALGSLLLFAGSIETRDATYEGQRHQRVWPARCQDHTRLLNRRRPHGQWINVSATLIVRDLVSRFSSGFTSANVQPDLPVVSISFTRDQDLAGCLTAVAALIGGRWFPDYSFDVHFFLDEVIAPTEVPDPLDINVRTLLHDPAITESVDLTQVRTRVSVRGHGEVTPTDVAAGESVLPIADAVMFNPEGGSAMLVDQLFTYTGVQLGSVGTRIGTSTSPALPPALSPAGGAGLSNGRYEYAYSFLTAAGESTISPIAAIDVSGGLMAPPTVAPVAALLYGQYTPNNPTYPQPFTDGDTYRFVYTWAFQQQTAASLANSSFAVAPGSTLLETLPSAISNSVTLTLRRPPGTPDSYPPAVDWPYIDAAPFPMSPAHFENPKPYYFSDQINDLIWPRFYRSENGGPFLSLDFGTALSLYGEWLSSYPGQANRSVSAGYLGQFNDAQATSYIVRYAPPTVATLELGQVLVALTLGPAGTTGRGIYRRDPGGTWHRIATVANNTATSYIDGAPVAAGVAPPTINTAGFVVETGTIPAFSSALPVNTIDRFDPAGGWAFVGTMPIRYAATSGGQIVGIPTTGLGSMTTPLAYGEAIDAMPALTGVTGIAGPVAAGTKINIWVQRDDVPAQEALALLEGGDGIHEYVISDERIREDTAARWAEADLALSSRPIVTLRYASRDPKTRSGKTVHVDLPELDFAGDYIIQSATITEIGFAVGVWPRWTVEASSVRFTLDDVLRRLALLP